MAVKECHRIKVRAKNLMRQIDLQQNNQAATGFVKESVFFEILALLKIKLGVEDLKILKEKFGDSYKQIEYKAALASLSVN